MKDILDEESRKALINYRIQRAYETMKEAKLMIRETFYNAAVNRMYLKGIHVVLSMKKWRINVNEGVRKGYPHLYIIVNFLPVLIYFLQITFPINKILLLRSFSTRYRGMQCVCPFSILFKQALLVKTLPYGLFCRLLPLPVFL